MHSPDRSRGVSLRQVSKQFGSTRVIDPLDLEIEEGAFVVLLGPSGCGKSTLLRMIAGLESPSSGRIHIHGIDVTDLPPRRRSTAMVFQSYALYAHLTVADNIAFPLKMQRWPWYYEIPLLSRLLPGRRALQAGNRARAMEIAQTVGLEALLDRKPRALSGGQRQRVALARAMIGDPAVFLMDEPLSNLDTQLRAATRSEITRLHQRLGRTFIYVTHDQVEAMTMGTRVIVMNGGCIQQDADPQSLFDRPANRFVAGFIGNPPMNLIETVVEPGGLRASEGPLLTGSQALVNRHGLQPGDAVTLGIRPEQVSVSASGQAMQVDLVERLGTEQIVTLRAGQMEILMRDSMARQYRPGDTASIRLDFEQAHLFARDTGNRLEEVAHARYGT